EVTDGRTPNRTKGAVSCRSTGRQEVFLVRMRQECQSAVLRRVPQGHGIHPGDVPGRKGSHVVFLRLQTHRRRTAVRWNSRETVNAFGGSEVSVTRPLTASRQLRHVVETIQESSALR